MTSATASSRSSAALLATARPIDDTYITSSHLKRESAHSESVDHYLLLLRPLLDDVAVQEIAINRPGAVCVETAAGWREVELPELTMARLTSLATAIATQTNQVIDAERPILSATLATDERIQIVLPPAVEPGTISITLRKPSHVQWTLHDFEQQGLFRDVELLVDSREDVAAAGGVLEPVEMRLLTLLWTGQIAEFMRAVVHARRNTVVSGATGSGKTTFMKTIIQECPRAERLVTIEDAREIFLPHHPNRVHLLYSKNGQGVAKVTATMLLVSCLRMKPDRILLAEIREGECYDFLRVAASGHPGSITSLHAGTCVEAFEQMALMVRQNPAGAGLSHAEILRHLRLVVDVIIQYAKDDRGRRVSQIYYRPLRKRIDSQ